MPFWFSTVLLGLEMGCFTAITLWYLKARRRIEGKREASAWELYCGLWSQDDDLVEALDSVSIPQLPHQPTENSTQNRLTHDQAEKHRL